LLQKHHDHMVSLLENGEILPVFVFLCSVGCPDGAANSMDRNNTNVMLHALGNFNSRHDLLAKSDSLCSDTVIPVPMYSIGYL
jgi:hypothetical protein